MTPRTQAERDAERAKHRPYPGQPRFPGGFQNCVECSRDRVGMSGGLAYPCKIALALDDADALAQERDEALKHSQELTVQRDECRRYSITRVRELKSERDHLLDVIREAREYADDHCDDEIDKQTAMFEIVAILSRVSHEGEGAT